MKESMRQPVHHRRAFVDGHHRPIEPLESRLFLAAQPVVDSLTSSHRVYRPQIVRTAVHVQGFTLAGTATSAQLTSAAQIQPAALASVNVSGQAQWSDAGGAAHGIPLAIVEIRSTAQANTDPPLATIRTDLTGAFSGSFSFDTSGGPLTIFARIFARNAAADVKPDTGVNAKTYFMDSAHQVVTAAGNVVLPARVGSNAIAAEQAFSILGATLEAATYAANVAGPDAAMPSQLDVRYPSNMAVNGTASFFDSGTRQLFVTQKRVFDWDVIQHEYGHYVQDRFSFSANEAGAHTFFASNPKPGGPGLSWNEGFATWFAISCQLAAGTPPYAAGVPGVGNTSFDPTGGPNADLATQTGVGELDEFSVASSLYHLAAGDQGIKVSDTKLFKAFIASKPTTFGAAWDAIATGASGGDRARIGHVLGLQNIAPVPTSPADTSSSSANSIPTFTWDKNGSNSFVIQFYSSDFQTLIDQTVELGNVNTFTPGAAEWAKIFDGHSTVKWVVEGKDTTSAQTPGSVADQTFGGNLDRYWSGAGTLNAPKIALVIDITGSMDNQIAAVQSALTQYIAGLNSQLSAGEAAPVIELITFVNDPTEVISSNDLIAVTNAVNAMHASGGGDFPEPSAQSLELAGQQIGAGGTILLVTDAPSDAGTDLTGTIAALRAKGVTVNAMISGDFSDHIQPSGDVSSRGSLGSPLLHKLPSPTVFSTHAITPTHSGSAFEPGGGGQNGPEPGQGPIDDPGQTPVDDSGNSTASATRMAVNGSIITGTVGNGVQDATGALTVDSSDVFVLQLLAGVSYNIPILTDRTGDLNAALLDTDGATTLQSISTTTGDIDSGFATLTFTPAVSGDYFLNLTPNAHTAYTVQVSDDPLVGATSSIALFSTVAIQTGGQFLFKDAISISSDPTVALDYRSSILNVMNSTFEPTVLSTTPGTVPLGATIDVTITGRGTNWLSGFSTLSFANAGITINSMAVTSATSLAASITIDPSATVDFADATVTTALGTSTETAGGVNSIYISPAPVNPTLLQVYPTTLAQGQTQTISIVGTGTAWDSTSTLSLGPGVTIDSFTVISPTRINAQVQVAGGTPIGFRMAVVTTGAVTDTQNRATLVSSATLASIATVTAASPAQAVVGTHADVTVTGMQTHFVAGLTTASFGPGVTIQYIEVTDATHAIVHLDVAPGAAIGFRNITMTTGSEEAAGLNGFFVASPLTTPVVSGVPSQQVFGGSLESISLGSFTADGPGPWTVDINWGDGTPNTTFTMDAPGVIAPQDHAFAGQGSKSMTVTVTNSLAPAYTGSAGATVNVVANTALLVTDPKGPSLLVAATGVLSATGSGSVFVNSTNPAAVTISGRHATAAAAQFSIVGGVRKGSVFFEGAIHTGQAPVADPLATLPAPALPAQVFKAFRYSGTAPVTLQPGAYAGGIHIGGRANVTLAPGLYYLQRGGLSVARRASLIGNGVTIYLTGRPSPINISGTLQLSAPTAGDYKGIVLFQDPASGSPVSITGIATLTGVVYAPSARLSLSGSGRFTSNADPMDVIDALNIFSRVRITGHGNMTIDSANNSIVGA